MGQLVRGVSREEGVEYLLLHHAESRLELVVSLADSCCRPISVQLCSELRIVRTLGRAVLASALATKKAAPNGSCRTILAPALDSGFGRRFFK